ncbi:hypothetical protein ACROYT_G041530 [Oculina patagonica]
MRHQVTQYSLINVVLEAKMSSISKIRKLSTCTDFTKLSGVQLEQNLNVHVLHADESFQEKPTLSEISINRKNILNIVHPCFEVSVTNNHIVLQY